MKLTDKLAVLHIATAGALLNLCKTGYHGEHATSVNNNGKPSLSDMFLVGESIRIPKEKAMDIIHTVYENCQNILSEEWKNNTEAHIQRNQQNPKRNRK